MRKLFNIGLLSITALLSSSVFATNLIDVFHDALANDPTFKASQAQYLANQENLPIARSYLLPNINIQGQRQRQYVSQSIAPFFIQSSGNNGGLYNTADQYSLNLSQPIFNYGAWYSVKNASYQVKQAEATFAAAAQDLMLRTAQAYFNVMQASDTLRYTLAQKKSVGEQLNQARQQYDVGLIAITGVSEAQANYDAIVANEISARNNLAIAMQQLSAITGRTYPSLMGVSSHLPLVRPNPDDINRWVYIAECQNYSLRAAIEGANAAQQTIEVRRGGHFPVINAIGSYTLNKNSNTSVTGFGKQETTAAGVSVNFPVYQGGLVNAQTQQAQYLYQQAISNMELSHRAVTTNARNAYLSVVTGINKIQADREAIVSAQIALKATREGYLAGTRTVLDVLNTQTSLYQAQINYSADQYSYLANILRLKQAAGTLSPSDLVKMNAWLRENVNIAGKIANLNNYTLNTNPASTRGAVTGEAMQSKPEYSVGLPLNASEKAKVAEIKQEISSKHSKQSKHSVQKLKAKSSHKITQQAESIKDDYYAIELFDTRYEQHAKNFIVSNNLKGKATYIKTTNAKGEARYQVVYGKYATLEAAEADMKKLSADLKKLNPWIKKLSR